MSNPDDIKTGRIVLKTYACVPDYSRPGGLTAPTTVRQETAKVALPDVSDHLATMSYDLFFKQHHNIMGHRYMHVHFNHETTMHVHSMVQVFVMASFVSVEI